MGILFSLKLNAQRCGQVAIVSHRLHAHWEASGQCQAISVTIHDTYLQQWQNLKLNTDVSHLLNVLLSAVYPQASSVCIV